MYHLCCTVLDLCQEHWYALNQDRITIQKYTYISLFFIGTCVLYELKKILRFTVYLIQLYLCIVGIEVKKYEK